MSNKKLLKRCQFPGCQQQVLSGYCFTHAKEVMIVSGYETRGGKKKDTVLSVTSMEKGKRLV